MSERLKPLGKMLERLDTASTFQIVGKDSERCIMGFDLATHQAVERGRVDAGGLCHGLKVSIRECGPDLIECHGFTKKKDKKTLHTPKF
jgi:predicted solute-binding protein